MARWIDDAQPDERITRLAARTLDARLNAAAKHLRAAAHEAHFDAEHVHNLRVATRRAVAGLELFEDLLPKRKRDWILRKLSKARRKAGDARDLDVFDARVAGWLGETAPETAIVREQIARYRQDVQPKIRRLYEKLRAKGFQSRAHKLVERTDWPDLDAAEEPTVSQEAKARCGPIIEEFDLAGRADLSDMAKLHAFRVSGKHLRYALEIFSAALDDSFRKQLFPELIALQDRVGAIVDQAVALSRLAEWISESAAGELRDALTAAHAKIAERLKQSQGQFVAWWTKEQAASFVAQIQRALDGESVSAANGLPIENSRHADASAEVAGSRESPEFS